MLTRDVGVASRRSKKPCSMSVASAAPPVTLPNSTPWMMVPAMAKSRKLSTSGKLGRATARPNDDAPSAAKNSGKISDGMTSAGWRTMAMIDRFDMARVCDHHRPRACTGALVAVTGKDCRGHLRRPRLPVGAGPPASVIAADAPSSR